MVFRDCIVIVACWSDATLHMECTRMGEGKELRSQKNTDMNWVSVSVEVQVESCSPGVYVARPLVTLPASLRIMRIYKNYSEYPYLGRKPKNKEQLRTRRPGQLRPSSFKHGGGARKRPCE